MSQAAWAGWAGLSLAWVVAGWAEPEASLRHWAEPEASVRHVSLVSDSFFAWVGLGCVAGWAGWACLGGLLVGLGREASLRHVRQAWPQKVRICLGVLGPYTKTIPIVHAPRILIIPSIKEGQAHTTWFSSTLALLFLPSIKNSCPGSRAPVDE